MWHEPCIMSMQGLYRIYEPAIIDRVIELGREGKGLVQIAADLGVARKTVKKWADANHDFADALEHALELAQSHWIEVLGGIAKGGAAAAGIKLILEGLWPDDWRPQKDQMQAGHVYVTLENPANIQVSPPVRVMRAGGKPMQSEDDEA